MTNHELGIQQSAKLLLQQQRHFEAERHKDAQMKAQALQKKMVGYALPQSSLKLRPTNQITQEKQRLRREDILQYSRNLRNTHAPNQLVLKFQMPGLDLDKDKEDKKFRATMKIMKQLQLDKRHHLEHLAAEETRQHQHTATKHLNF